MNISLTNADASCLSDESVRRDESDVVLIQYPLICLNMRFTFKAEIKVKQAGCP